MPQFTKLAIINTFIKLLNQMPLDKITVKDIVDDCGINRNTFYYYYKDIYALLDDIFRADTQKVIEENGNFKSLQDGFLQATEFARENKKAVYHIYNSMSREKLENYLYSIIDDLIAKYVDTQETGRQIADEDKRFLADFYKYALVGMILAWISKGMKEDPEFIIPRLVKLIYGSSQMFFSEPIR